MGNIQTAGPNEALIVSGGCCRPSRKQIIVGGWCWNTWMLTNIQRISLQIMTLNPKCEHVQSVQGVPVTVTGVVHCKIMSAPEFLPLAAEQFLGKSTDHIKSVILHTVEGHMRAVIGTQPIEEICQKRQTLASLIRSAAIDDLSRMGIDILSLTIREIKDDVEYLNSAGKKATATAKMKASVSTAKADSDASKREAELQKQRKEEEIAVEKDLAELKHNLDKAKHETDEIVGHSTADATKAYDLQLALLQKDIRVTEMEVKSHELENLVKVQQKENERHKTELEIEIKLPCDAEIYELKKQTEAFEKKNAIETAAEEFRIITEGQARANATKLEGNAEADGMRKVAEARKEFNEAAVLFEVLKVLPDIAAEIASPLNKFEEIVLISDGATQNKNKSSHDQHKSADTKGNILRSATSGLAAEASKLSSAVPMAVRAVGGSERLSSNIVNSILQLQKSAG